MIAAVKAISLLCAELRMTEVDGTNGVERLDDCGSLGPAPHLLGRRRRQSDDESLQIVGERIGAIDHDLACQIACAANRGLRRAPRHTQRDHLGRRRRLGIAGRTYRALHRRDHVRDAFAARVRHAENDCMPLASPEAPKRPSDMPRAQYCDSHAACTRPPRRRRDAALAFHPPTPAAPRRRLGISPAHPGGAETPPCPGVVSVAGAC